MLSSEKYVDNGYRYRDLLFSGLKLRRFKEETGYSIEQDKKYNWMYWIRFPNGNRSANFYNSINAKENCKLHYLESKNSNESVSEGSQEPVDAFKLKR